MRLFGFILIVFFAVSCGKVEPTKYSDAPQVEALSDPNLFPSTVMVVLPQGNGICTGTFISPKTVLTAAHCTKEVGRYQVVTAFGTFSTYTTERLGPGVLEDPRDVALLIFSSNVAKRSKKQVSILGRSAQVGERIGIVGYGCNDLTTRRGTGVKRAGTNRIAQVGDYIELGTPFSSSSKFMNRPILGPKDEAGSCFGDSGGPMLGTGESDNLILGVTHAGGTDGSQILSQYINLGRSDIRDFITSVDGQYSLGVYDLCNSQDAFDIPTCSVQSATMHFMAQIQAMFTKLALWMKSWVIKAMAFFS